MIRFKTAFDVGLWVCILLLTGCQWTSGVLRVASFDDKGRIAGWGVVVDRHTVRTVAHLASGQTFVKVGYYWYPVVSKKTIKGTCEDLVDLTVNRRLPYPAEFSDCAKGHSGLPLRDDEGRVIGQVSSAGVLGVLCSAPRKEAP